MATMTRWLRLSWRRRRSARDQTEIVLFLERAHLSQNPVAPLGNIARRPIGMQAIRVRQDRSQHGRLTRRQARGGDVKKLLRGRLDAINAGSELRNVEIGLEDALLGPQRLDEYREPCLQGLAQVTLAGP